MAAHPDLDLARRLSRRLLPWTVLVAIIISVGLPATYYLLESRAMRRTADLHAGEFAAELHKLVLDSPSLWMYQAEKYVAAVEAFTSHKDILGIRVLDPAGTPITALAYLKGGSPSGRASDFVGTAPIVFNNRTVGMVEVAVSSRGLVATTFQLFLGSAAGGGALALLLHLFPVRVVRGMERHLGELLERLQRSHAELERRADELGTLLAVSRAATSTGDEQALFQLIADGAARACGADRCAVFLWDERGDVAVPLMPSAGAGAHRYRLADTPFLAELSKGGEAVLVTDPAHDPRVPPAWPRRVELAAVLAAPLIHAGRAIGAVVLERRVPAAAFDADGVRLAMTLAGQAALAIQNAGLVRNLQHTLDDLSRAQHRLVQGETLRAVGELAAGMSHHLNNLLTVVLGRLELLLMRVADESTRQPLEVARRAGLDAADVVRRVMEFTRTQRPSQVAALDLNAEIREVVELSRARWENAATMEGIHIDVNVVPGDLGPISVDGRAIREVLMNLVLNAVDAMPQGGTLTFRTWADGGAVYCAVTDTGVGMSAEVRARAFQPFFTTKGVRRTGLGLSTSYSIVRRHGGDLTLESEEGRGSTVTIRLPVDVVPGSRASTLDRTSPAKAALHILVVDDDRETRALLEEMLTALGHRVTLAPGGPEALAMLEEGPEPDLVLTDLGMPTVNGWQVAAAAKARYPGLPVALVTGWGEEPPSWPEKLEYVDSIIAKPFQRGVLAAEVARLSRAS